MEATKKKEFQSLSYGLYWPAVLMSERAQGRADELDILYIGFRRALHRAIAGLLQNGKAEPDHIQVFELMAEDDLPQGIRVSFKFHADALLICDIWTPAQPTLF